jgi:transcriptional regulator with XRE-family HTH domain
MECQNELGRLLREAREAQGLSQRRLAVRAATSQDAISRIERGAEAPTVERFAQLMLAMGMRAELKVEPLESSVPDGELAVAAAASATERLREAASWNRAMSQLSAAGAAARRAGDPATESGIR